MVVEAANGEDTLADVANEVHDGGPAFGVADGGHKLPRLVEHDVEMLLRTLNASAIDTDVVGGEVGLGAEGGDDFAVYGDASAGDELLSLAAGCDACGGEDLLQTF